MYPLSLTLLHSGAFPECTARIERRFEYFTLQLMTAGAIELAYGEEKTTLEGSWFWFAKSGPRIGFYPAPGCGSWNHRFVVFHGPLANCWQAEGLLPNCAQPIPSIADGKDYVAVFDELLFQAHRSHPWGQARAINLLEQMVLALAEARTQAPVSHAWLRTALDWLESAEAFTPDYAEMASDLGMSLSALRERFRQMAGKPLHAYVLEARMTRARALLRDTELPLKEVAARLGYSDVYYFHRQFQQMVGLTPTAYHKSRQS